MKPSLSDLRRAAHYSVCQFVSAPMLWPENREAHELRGCLLHHLAIDALFSRAEELEKERDIWKQTALTLRNSLRRLYDDGAQNLVARIAELEKRLEEVQRRMI